MKNKTMLMALSVLTFLFMLTLNALANILPINGYNTGQLSDMYPNLFVPAGITFSIWGLIYIALILFIYGLYKLKLSEEKGFMNISILFSISNLLNGCWILAWHYKFVFISLIIMILLLITLSAMYSSVKKLNNSKGVFLVKSATSLYLGWISLATVANFSAFLVNIGWNRFGFSEVFWTLFMIIVVLGLTIVFLLREKDIVFSLVVLWAYWGIVIKRLATVPVYNQIVITTELSIVVVFVLMLLTVLRLFKKS